MGSSRANSGAAEDRGGKLARTIEPDLRWDTKLTLPTLHHAVPVPRNGVLPKHVGPAELDGAITNAARIRREHERNVRQARETEKGSGREAKSLTRCRLETDCSRMCTCCFGRRSNPVLCSESLGP